MDETPPPTAAELGISDTEYARILHDLRGRTSSPQLGPPAPTATPNRAPRRLWLIPIVVVVLLAVVTRGDGIGPGGSDPTYAFLQTVEDRPVTYASCRPVQVAIYPAGGPSDAEALVREAVDVMRSTTGLDIVVTGAFGGSAPNWNFEAAPVLPDDPISVSWQDAEAIARLTDDTAGLGGSRTITGSDGEPRLVAGTIALSRDYYASLDERGDHDEALAVLLHEFGHVFGLAHVDSSAELMYDDNVGRTSFGAGDLEGLRLLGRGPCN